MARGRHSAVGGAMLGMDAAVNDAVATSVKATKAKGAALVDRLGRLEHDAASAEEVALLREELAETRVAVRRLESQVAVLAEVVEKEEAQNRRFLEALLTAPPPGMSETRPCCS